MAGGMRLHTTGAATANGNEVNCGGLFGDYVLSIETTDVAITGGLVTWEHAPTVGYTGTWENIGDPIAPERNSIVTRHFTGALNAVRGRISTTIAGPTIIVRLQTPVLGE